MGRHLYFGTPFNFQTLHRIKDCSQLKHIIYQEENYGKRK